MSLPLHAGHNRKRNKKRLGCCNFVNIFFIEPNFCREIEHDILTELDSYRTCCFLFLESLHFGGKIMLLISPQKTK